MPRRSSCARPPHSWKPQYDGSRKRQSGNAALSQSNEIVGRINELGAISETPEHLARIFLTRSTARGGQPDPELDAGGRTYTHLDAMRKSVARIEGDQPLDAGIVLRHRSRGRQMGAAGCGLIAAICLRGRSAQAGAAIGRWRSNSPMRRAWVASTLLGSRAVAGTFVESVLHARDGAGVMMRDALVQFGLDPDGGLGVSGADARRAARLHRTSYRAGAGVMEIAAQSSWSAISGATSLRHA